RAGGLILGAWIGGTLSRASSEIKSWIGLALMPQAGVALGMALVAVNRFTEYKDLIFPVVIGATILFELFGPILTRTALIRAGAVPPKA
ncbi:MAG: cation:proton antiporter, partial [Nitrospinaceae bacterium]|nr:cation:proton antiporter [Nitrospinaceae bacterium]NIR53925.1 cation:proton antiporter [Nitrospinaceae bacterium]NIS84343.1 cation:proton antiporter [Nitrospinaceae bacterium]NIT81146.1 cation:proton antiporter [Nitrospinaceae bacterium]NIU43428.1 cation:proton antiporter [Nitrospinaceae bacterium]